MQVHVFRNISSQFGFTNDPTSARLPVRSGPWEHIKDVDLNPGEYQHGIKADNILDNLSTNGHFVAAGHATINEI